jgi:putative ABC transport system permease protein
MSLPNGGFESILVVGCETRSLLGNAWAVSRGQPSFLRRPESVIVDELESDKLDFPQLGDLREVNHRRVRVEAMSHGILGFIVAPYVFMTLDQAASQLRKGSDACSYILVRTAQGADPSDVAKAIRLRCPELDAHPTSTFSRICIDFWLRRTGLGISFGASTILGLFVGLVMVAQTLYASVLDRLSEFAAMKAIGAEDRHVYRLLLGQAVAMAVAGTLIGVLCSTCICLAFSTPRAPIVIPWWLTAGSCVLVTTICLIASLLPYLRIRKLDPVTVMLA